jgi:hypothetical protein
MLRTLPTALPTARLRRIAPEHANLLEVRQMRVHGRGRRKAYRFADVAHRRWIAVLGRVLADEVEYLLLALGQIHVSYAPRSGGRLP